MKSVKSKIIALVLTCILFSSIAIGTASILNSRRVVSSNSAQIMNQLCTNRAEKINALLARIEQSVKTLTVYAVQQVKSVERFQTDPDYVNGYTESLMNVAINAAQNTEGAMTVYIRYNPEFTDPQSGLFCSKNPQDTGYQRLTPTDLSAFDPTDQEHVGWFYAPVSNRKGTWLSPYYNKNINTRMISYVIPFYVDGVLIGVVGMDIDFSILENIVEDTNVYQSGYAFLTDSQANIVYHRQLKMGTSLLEYNGGEFRDMALLIQSGEVKTGLHSYTFNGEHKRMTIKSLINGMRISLTAPAHEIDEEANLLLLQMVVSVLIIVSLAIVLTIVFTRRLVKPLIELNEAAKKIAEGDFGISIAHKSRDEVGNLAESFRQTVTHLNKYINYINELAYRDSLTGVKNKTAYVEAVKRLDDQIHSKKTEFAVIVFDINGLKEVNDSMGHNMGDILIANTCALISKIFCACPVYRIGGDEFVVILENEEYGHYSELFQQFQQEIKLFNGDPSCDMPVSVASGLSVCSHQTDISYNDVFKRADSAMYRHKLAMKRAEPESRNKNSGS